MEQELTKEKIQEIKEKWKDPIPLICDICKKELISVYIWEKEERTFVTCRACKRRGIIPCAKPKENVKSDDSQGNLTAQETLKAEKRRFAERLKRQRDKEEKSKTLLENAVGNRSLLSGVRYL